MKKTFLIILALTLAIPFTFAMAFAGNGAPSGSHYSLNLIAKEDCKSADMDGSNRHTIFVLLTYSPPAPTSPTTWTGTTLDRKNRIFLQQGDTFQVLDGNACDGATFQLPANACSDWESNPPSECTYDVYIRGLGSPQGNPYAKMTTCRIDYSQSPDVYQCSTEYVTVSRDKGKSSFTNVTRELTSLCLDTNTDGNYDGKCDVRAMLFEDTFYEYFWNYDNHGLRLAQLRFYPRAP